MANIYRQQGLFAGIFAFVTLVLFFTPLLLPFQAKAVGATPSRFTNITVLRGTTQTQSLYITRTPSEAERSVTVNVSKQGEYADYLKAPETILFVQGQDKALYTFEIDATDAAAGDYTVSLSFLVDPVMPEGETGAVVGFITGVSIPVNFSVSGDQVVGYEVGALRTEDTEIGQPIYLSFDIQNTGNVDWKPDSAEITFIDIDDPTNTVIETISGEDFPVVKPSSDSSTTMVQAASELMEGTYNVYAKLYYEGVLAADLVSQSPLAVFPKGTLAQSGELVSASVNKTTYEIGEKVNLSSFFKNTGQIRVNASLYIDLYKDGNYVDLLRGETLDIDTGDEVKFSHMIEPDGVGQYKASVYFKYGNKKTNPEEVLFSVVSSGTVGDTLSFFDSYLGLIILAAVILIAAIVIKIVKKKKSSQPLTVAASIQTIPTAPTTTPVTTTQTTGLPTINQVGASQNPQGNTQEALSSQEDHTIGQ